MPSSSLTNVVPPIWAVRDCGSAAAAGKEQASTNTNIQRVALRIVVSGKFIGRRLADTQSGGLA